MDKEYKNRPEFSLVLIIMLIVLFLALIASICKIDSLENELREKDAIIFGVVASNQD